MIALPTENQAWFRDPTAVGVHGPFPHPAVNLAPLPGGPGPAAEPRPASGAQGWTPPPASESIARHPWGPPASSLVPLALFLRNELPRCADLQTSSLGTPSLCKPPSSQQSLSAEMEAEAASARPPHRPQWWPGVAARSPQRSRWLPPCAEDGCPVHTWGRGQSFPLGDTWGRGQSFPRVLLPPLRRCPNHRAAERARACAPACNGSGGPDTRLAPC